MREDLAFIFCQIYPSVFKVRHTPDEYLRSFICRLDVLLGHPLSNEL